MIEQKDLPIKIFFSYAKEDEILFQTLDKHLSVLKHQNLIITWCDSNIYAGQSKDQEIKVRLESADIVLLLLSADYVASNYYNSIEMQNIIKKHALGQKYIIPIIMRPIDWSGTLFEKLQVLPRNGKPITNWPNPDEAFEHIALEIRMLIRSLHQQTPTDHVASLSIQQLPYERNFLFTGREEAFEKLCSLLYTGHVIALSGLGGIGKTQIALEYAYRYQNDYSNIIWIKSGSDETLHSIFLIIAQQLKLPEQFEQDQSLVIYAVKVWLQKHDRWLLILDNVENLSLLSHFPPVHAHGHLLVTTQEQVTGSIAQSLNVEKMEPEQGAIFLLRRAKILGIQNSLDQASVVDRELAKEFVHLVDGFPLALDQAGAYIEETRSGLDGYIHLYRTRQDYLLNQRGSIPTDHPASVMVTLSLAFEKIKRSNHKAGDLLRLCAFLDPETIPEEIIINAVSVLPPALQSLASNPIEMNKAVRGLLSYSLIHRNPDHSFTIHRLVQAVLKHSMKPKTQRIWAERAIRVVELSFPEISYTKTFPQTSHTTWHQCQKYLPSAQLCKEFTDQWKLTIPEAAYLFTRVGHYLVKNAEYALAETFYQLALTIQEQNLGFSHPVIAQLLHPMAHLYQDQGKYELSENFHLRELNIYKSSLGDAHPSSANSLHCLATLYRDQGKYEQAEYFYLHAFTTSEYVWGLGHPNTTRNVHGLAHLYQDQCKYEQAETHYLYELEILEETYGQHHPTIIDRLHCVAGLYQEQGKYKQAEELYQHALELQEQNSGSEHPKTASVLYRIAELYQSQGKYQQAESCYQRDLLISEKVLGSNHPHVATTLQSLAGLYQEQGKYQQAEALYQRALCIREQTLGPEHPKTAAILQSLAGFYQEQHNFEQAGNLYQQVLAIQKHVLGANHRDTTLTLYKIAELYQLQGKYDLAESLYKQALTTIELTLIPQNLSSIVTLRGLAGLYQELGKYKQAEELYQNALLLEEQLFGPESPGTTITLYCTAHLYQVQKKYDLAESFYRQALVISQQAFGPSHPKTATILYSLAECYQDQEKYELARSFYQQALTIRQQSLEPNHPSIAATRNRLSRLS